MAKLKMAASIGDLASADDSAVLFSGVAAELSAELMVDAYRGTVDWSEGDDASVALAEIRSTLDGAYGEFLDSASLAFLDATGRPIAQISCSIFESEATILFVYTGAAQKGKGLATRLIRASAAEVAKLGFSSISLYVTDINPAKELYEKLGFVVLANG